MLWELGYDTTDETLHAVFLPFGKIEEAVVAKERETGNSRGFGFVTYSSPSEASSALDKLDQTEIDGRIIRVNFSQPREKGGAPGWFNCPNSFVNIKSFLNKLCIIIP